MARRKPKFLRNFNKFLGKSYPNFIKNILFSSGFDNKNSLELIDEESIKNIEEYVNKNRYHLKKTSYEKTLNKTDKFEFSIGHKVLLTNIPKYVEKFENESLKKLQDKKKEGSLEESDASLDPSALRKTLLEKLQNYSTSSKLNFKISEENIENLENKNQRITCKVHCPFCSKKYLILFKHNWKISNITVHIRKHFTIETVNVLVNSDNDNNLGDDTRNVTLASESASSSSVENNIINSANNSIIRLHDLPQELESILQ